MKTYEEKITELIMNADAGKLIMLDMPQLDWVNFDFDKYEKEYGWIARYRNSYAIGYMHPMKTLHQTKSWKTLKGAKRNFLKAIERMIRYNQENGNE